MPLDADPNASPAPVGPPAAPPASPRSTRVQRSITAPGDMRLYEGSMRLRDSSIDGEERRPTPYSSWSSSSPAHIGTSDRRHSGRVYTFMPSTARVPVPPPRGPVSPTRTSGSLARMPASPQIGPPALRRGAPYSPDMSEGSSERFAPLEPYLPAGCGPPDARDDRRSSVTSLPPGSPPLPTTVSCGGETYFEHASDAGSGSYFSLSPRSWHRGSDGTTTLTSPPPSEAGCQVLDSTLDEATYWPERRPLDPGALHQHASIGRSVDDALSALLGATSLVKAGLGSAALVIGPVDAPHQQRTIGDGRRHSVDAPRRTPSPPSSSGGSGAAMGSGQRLVTVRPAGMTTMSAHPRAIRASVVPPVPRLPAPPSSRS